MKLEALKSQSTEVFVEGDGVNVTCNAWSNHEGVNIMVLGSGAESPMRMAGAFRWEEVDAILVALTVARSAT